MCGLLAQVLPGSAPNIVNYDLPRGTINSVFVDGIDPAFVESYRSRYVSLNPWMDFWASAPSGTVFASERESPSHAFRHTEFYNDWLAPHGGIGAAVGMRLDVGPHDTVQVNWQYDVTMAEQLDAPAAAILSGFRPALAGAVRAAALLRDGLEGGLRLGALIERIDGAALLVERDRRIREANAEAAAALQWGAVFSGTNNVLAMRDPATQRWLEETVARLIDGEPSVEPVITFALEGRILRMSVTLAPEYPEAGFALLVRPRPLVLVTVRMLVGGPVGLDAAALRMACGLSAAEIRLCELLLNGYSLQAAAAILGVSDGTVRQRVKVIFHKTQTHRQGELVALLARFGVGGWRIGDSG